MTNTADAVTDRTIVRRATVHDVHNLVVFGKGFIDESGYTKRGVEPDPWKLHQSLHTSVTSADEAVFLAEREGRIVGVAALMAFATFFSSTRMAIERFWWVEPGLRSSGATAMRLLNELFAWSAASGCAHLCMVDLPEIGGPAERIYQRLGFELVERTWIKRIDQWQQ